MIFVGDFCDLGKIASKVLQSDLVILVMSVPFKLYFLRFPFAKKCKLEFSFQNPSINMSFQKAVSFQSMTNLKSF